MFNFFKKKPSGTVATFTIDGMHCTSCSMNIDGELEDSAGVISASTSYPRATTTVEYDADQITAEDLKAIIERLGYDVAQAD